MDHTIDCDLLNSVVITANHVVRNRLQVTPTSGARPPFKQEAPKFLLRALAIVIWVLLCVIPIYAMVYFSTEMLSLAYWCWEWIQSLLLGLVYVLTYPIICLNTKENAEQLVQLLKDLPETLWNLVPRCTILARLESASNAVSGVGSVVANPIVSVTQWYHCYGEGDNHCTLKGDSVDQRNEKSLEEWFFFLGFVLLVDRFAKRCTTRIRGLFSTIFSIFSTIFGCIAWVFQMVAGRSDWIRKLCCRYSSASTPPWWQRFKSLALEIPKCITDFYAWHCSRCILNLCMEMVDSFWYPKRHLEQNSLEFDDKYQKKLAIRFLAQQCYELTVHLCDHRLWRLPTGQPEPNTELFNALRTWRSRCLNVDTLTDHFNRIALTDSIYQGFTDKPSDSTKRVIHFVPAMKFLNRQNALIGIPSKDHPSKQAAKWCKDREQAQIEIDKNIDKVCKISPLLTLVLCFFVMSTFLFFELHQYFPFNCSSARFVDDGALTQSIRAKFKFNATMWDTTTTYTWKPVYQNVTTPCHKVPSNQLWTQFGFGHQRHQKRPRDCSKLQFVAYSRDSTRTRVLNTTRLDAQVLQQFGSADIPTRLTFLNPTGNLVFLFNVLLLCFVMFLLNYIATWYIVWPNIMSD